MNCPVATELSQKDCDVIVWNLDACLALLDKNVGRRSLAQIQARSMIAVLRGEVAKAARKNETAPAFTS